MGGLFGGGGERGANSLDELKQRQLAAEQNATAQLKEIQPQQSAFAQQLAQGAMGQGPSLADAQMKLAMDRSLQQQMAAAQAQRGGNPALAGRNAAMGAAQTGMDIAGQAGAARLQEQRNQQGAFQNYLGGQQQYQTTLSVQAAQTAQAQAKMEQERNSKNTNVLGGLLQTAGTIVGGIYGGPAGAAAGGALGGLVGGVASGGGDNSSSSSLGANTQLGPAMKEISSPSDAGSLQMPSSSVPTSNFQSNAGLGGEFKFSKGGMVQAPEVVKGDSEHNDLVPTLLSGGEVVVPKTVVEKGGKAAGEFVEALKAHLESKERLKNATFGDILMARQTKEKKV